MGMDQPTDQPTNEQTKSLIEALCSRLKTKWEKETKVKLNNNNLKEKTPKHSTIITRGSPNPRRDGIAT
jgi:hypothetical protein